MNAQELRELDAWIAEHTMGWKRHESKPYIPAAKVTTSALATWQDGRGKIMAFIKEYSPTTDPAAAMEVLKKCVEGEVTVAINRGSTGDWWISDCDKKTRYAIAETLELAICLFAKKLFTK